MKSTYKTKPGDTISKMMEKFHTLFTELEDMNDLSSIRLLEGQILLIPLSRNSRIELHHHLIDKNNTIDEIVKKYNITYDELKYFNNFYQIILQENQILNIEKREILPVADEFIKS